MAFIKRKRSNEFSQQGTLNDGENENLELVLNVSKEIQFRGHNSNTDSDSSNTPTRTQLNFNIDLRFKSSEARNTEDQHNYSKGLETSEKLVKYWPQWALSIVNATIKFNDEASQNGEIGDVISITISLQNLDEADYVSPLACKALPYLMKYAFRTTKHKELKWKLKESETADFSIKHVKVNFFRGALSTAAADSPSSYYGFNDVSL
ncbi:hypothetical protein QAD02_003203 [Eretmocerus hayati]|uniref:Uncharacterized protein n=1 Tax=Eretmocerus hayati TaxID=131215 RepID=A0ACC2NNQ5_9HYME|nr:hypothetical protein QAD02_003203 [Eretmocerus hayati]